MAVALQLSEALGISLCFPVLVFGIFSTHGWRWF
jgi:hypothetical protein